MQRTIDIDIIRAIDSLPEREKTIIKSRCGINCEKETFNILSIKYGVSKERIRQIEAKALRKLAHPARLGNKTEILYTLRKR